MLVLLVRDACSIENLGVMEKHSSTRPCMRKTSPSQDMGNRNHDWKKRKLSRGLADSGSVSFWKVISIVLGGPSHLTTIQARLVLASRTTTAIPQAKLKARFEGRVA